MNGASAVDLVLASTSAYRRDLLARFGLPFRTIAPGVDETPEPGENAASLAVRLAQRKAHAVALRCPGAVVIGSDQAAECDGALLGKPGDAAAAQGQLERASGRAVVFHTALCVVDTRGDAHVALAACDRTTVRFRELAAQEIARYVARDRPLDCAGSFKAEGLGIALFERIDSLDPSALIGLPLIALSRLLRELGVEVI